MAKTEKVCGAAGPAWRGRPSCIRKKDHADKHRDVKGQEWWSVDGLH